MFPTSPALVDATISLENRVALLTLNRHDVRNALTGTALVDDIIKTIDWVNLDKEVSVLIISGAGSAFSSGGDVKDMATRSNDFAGDVAELEERYRRGIQRMPIAISRCEIPIIAAINGPAIGAGFDLANMCDLRIASSKAKFGETFVNLGIIPGDGGAWFMQRLIGYQRAAELTFTGRIINAAEAKEYGIVLDVVEPDQLLNRATALATDIAAKPGASLRLTKRLMKMAQRQELPDFLDLCAVFQGMCHNNLEHVIAAEKLLATMSK
jgi:enoyl-CoA hydratase/carnithine racemase